MLLMNLLIISILLQIGCWSEIELTKIAVVTAIGIDINDNKEVEVSLQFVKPKADTSGGAKGGSAGEAKQYVVKTCKDKTVFEAVRNMINTIDRVVFYSNVKAIVFGEKLAKEGIASSLDVFKRQTQTPPTAKVLVADGISAKEVLETESEFEKIPAVSLSNIEDNSHMRFTIVEETLLELLQDIETPGKDVILGRAYKKGEKDIAVEGGAVFKEEKLVGWLDDELTRGYRYVKGDIQSGTQELKGLFGGKMIVSLETVKAGSKIKVEFVDGKPNFIIDIKQVGSVAEINSPPSLMQKVKAEGLKEAFSKNTEASVIKMIDFMRENKSDILGLGNTLYKFHYNYWKQVSDDWSRELSKVPIEVKVQSEIERAGFLIQ